MAKRFNGVWPPPVYCAQFADGSTMRMSFWTRAGKPLDYARGRHLCCAIRGQEQEKERSKTYRWEPDAIKPIPPTLEELEAQGYFESIEYRRVLRHYAQKLIDECVTELCGSPMPITIQRYACVNAHGIQMTDQRSRKKLWNTRRIGHDSVPLFCTFLPGPAPATDIVDGWVEKGDETFPDPHFAPQISAELIQLPKRRRAQSDLEKALALLAKLGADERRILAERIAA